MSGEYSQRLFALFRRHRRTAAGILGASIVLNLCGLVAPRLTQAVLDNLGDHYWPTSPARHILLLALAGGIQVGLGLWRRLSLVGVSLAIDHDLLSGYVRHLLSLPLAYFRHQRTGELLARLQDHVHVRHILAGGLTTSTVDGLMVLVYVTILFAYSARLALLVVVVLLLLAIYTALLSPMIKRAHRLLLKANAAHEAGLVETLTGIDLVRALAAEEVAHGRWADAFEKCRSQNYRTQRLRQLLDSGRAALQFLSTAGVLWYGAVLVGRGELTAGQFVACGMYAGLAVAPLLTLLTIWDDIQQARASAERVEEVLRQEPELGDAVAAPRVEPLRGNVAFEAVSFQYAGADHGFCLRGLNFQVREGEHLLIMGSSGSGKTTVARLLLGLYRPISGRIVVDGQDLQGLDIRAYRRQLGVVLQENVLFAGTISENIGLGERTPDPDQVFEAASMSGAHDFIASLPAGYDTVVGERGLTLSGGQRQRVALARALYRNPRIVILDEPTSSLDQRSEHDVLRHLERVLRDRTAIIISHRITPFRTADRILVLENGLLAEEGSYDELVNRRKVFRSMLYGDAGSTGLRDHIRTT